MSLEYDFFRNLPTRSGNAQGDSIENRMIGQAGGADSIRTVMLINPDGSTTTLKTRGGAPHFWTDEVAPKELGGYKYKLIGERINGSSVPNQSCTIVVDFVAGTAVITNIDFDLYRGAVGTDWKKYFRYLKWFNQSDATKFIDFMSSGRPGGFGPTMAFLAVNIRSTFFGEPFGAVNIGSSPAMALDVISGVDVVRRLDDVVKKSDGSEYFGAGAPTNNVTIQFGVNYPFEFGSYFCQFRKRSDPKILISVNAIPYSTVRPAHLVAGILSRSDNGASGSYSVEHLPSWSGSGTSSITGTGEIISTTHSVGAGLPYDDSVTTYINSLAASSSRSRSFEYVIGADETDAGVIKPFSIVVELSWSASDSRAYNWDDSWTYLPDVDNPANWHYRQNASTSVDAGNASMSAEQKMNIVYGGTTLHTEIAGYAGTVSTSSKVHVNPGSSNTFEHNYSGSSSVDDLITFAGMSHPEGHVHAVLIRRTSFPVGGFDEEIDRPLRSSIAVAYDLHIFDTKTGKKFHKHLWSHTVNELMPDGGINLSAPASAYHVQWHGSCFATTTSIVNTWVLQGDPANKFGGIGFAKSDPDVATWSEPSTNIDYFTALYSPSIADGTYRPLVGTVYGNDELIVCSVRHPEDPVIPYTCAIKRDSGTLVEISDATGFLTVYKALEVVP